MKWRASEATTRSNSCLYTVRASGCSHVVLYGGAVKMPDTSTNQMPTCVSYMAPAVEMVWTAVVEYQQRYPHRIISHTKAFEAVHRILSETSSFHQRMHNVKDKWVKKVILWQHYMHVQVILWQHCMHVQVILWQHCMHVQDGRCSTDTDVENCAPWWILTSSRSQHILPGIHANRVRFCEWLQPWLLFLPHSVRT